LVICQVQPSDRHRATAFVATDQEGQQQMMNLKKAGVGLAASGLLSVGAWSGLAGVAQAATTPGASPAVSPAADGAWPAQVNGRPSQLKAGAALGYYVWHDNNAWHLEVTHPNHNHIVFSGWVSTNGTLSVQRVDDERNDVTRVGPGRREVSFAFNNYGYLDGIHFETRGAQELTFHLYVNGAPIGPTRAFIGRADLHPLHVPFQVDRTSIRY
jgi:hypothetical protein